MHTNRLAGEKSPYLLQHAHNPVDWYPWGEEAFTRARAEDKPIFLSIGYSTCHWCHVMEHESFENDAIAALLNRDFIAIKVDREERPDVDRIYMTFVQATSGGGGWPMSVWLTPLLEPFFGGTYFPPENRWGHPGFGSVLTQIAAAWRSDRDKILESARGIVEQLEQHAAVEPAHAGVAFDAATLDSGFSVFRRTFDSRLGGFGGAPKFPRPSVLNFLLRYHARTQNPEAREMVLLTLREMARGGMHDQLGGGFHRYAVDDRWFVPHFEKMLYDQAQLAVAYLEAFQLTGDERYAGSARRILDYVLRDMTDPEGGFYSAEDADSVIDAAHPEHKGEGAFYIWSADEIRARAGANADLVIFRYGVRDGGNVDHDPQGEFTGRNILYQANTIEDTARHFNRSLDDTRAALALAADALLAARAERVRPHLDDKILTSWNGLMISAFALGGAVLEDGRYAKAARRAADFVIARLYQASSGGLLRRYRAGEAAIPAFLDDYALFTQALIDLYEAQFDPDHLRLALGLTETMRVLFEDPASGAFFSSPAGDSSLVLRVKEDYDGAEPSGNSVAALNLLRLSRMTNRPDFAASAQRTFAAFGSRLQHAPMAVPQMLVACEFALAEPREIIFAGDPAGAALRPLVEELRRHFLPNRVVLLADPALAGSIPGIEAMVPGDTGGRVYVCRNYTCQLPVSAAAEFAELIQ
jgi:uncharacterized protein YyaL (SSP411 family)